MVRRLFLRFCTHRLLLIGESHFRRSDIRTNCDNYDSDCLRTCPDDHNFPKVLQSPDTAGSSATYFYIAWCLNVAVAD